MKRPVYNHDPGYAREHAELDSYRESNRLNEQCARVVEREIREHFDGYRLPKCAIEHAVDECGLERVSYVLAFTVKEKEYDGRFGRDVKEWARNQSILAATEWSRWCVNSHPAVLDGFIRHVMHMNRVG